MKNMIFTIGQGRKSIEKFLTLLSEHEINLLVDVRSIPYSKFSDFRRGKLEKFLKEKRIKYLYMGDRLGGENIRDVYCRQNGSLYDVLDKDSFREGLRTLWKLRKDYRVCLFCAEEDPLRCHRFLCIGAILSLRGNIEVENIQINRTENFEECTTRLMTEEGHRVLAPAKEKEKEKEIEKVLWKRLHHIYLNWNPRRKKHKIKESEDEKEESNNIEGDYF